METSSFRQDHLLCPQDACLRGTTAATVHLGALVDEVAGVQEDLDRVPGEEDRLTGGPPGGVSEGGSLKLVPTFQLVCEQT